MINQKELFFRLWKKLADKNIDPRKLEVTVERDYERQGSLVSASLLRYKRQIAAQYFISDLELDNMNDPEISIAERTAFRFEHFFFPQKIKWVLAFEKKMDEMYPVDTFERNGVE
jgi:hypothetical protein